MKTSTSTPGRSFSRTIQGFMENDGRKSDVKKVEGEKDRVHKIFEPRFCISLVASVLGLKDHGVDYYMSSFFNISCEQVLIKNFFYIPWHQFGFRIVQLANEQFLSSWKI